MQRKSFDQWALFCIFELLEFQEFTFLFMQIVFFFSPEEKKKLT